jgi:hypothetical protein
LGDSVCSFNPTYGQGMSTAALQAEAQAACGPTSAAYPPRVFLATQVSDDVCRRFIEVSALLKPPPALLTPAMIVKVLVASRRARRTVAPLPARAPQPTTAAAA